jgi:cobalt/nickel transport system ATP-binding protein
MSDCLIAFDHVTFGYSPDRPVLQDCDFELGAGQRVGLVGPNGSGKTTLLSLVVGLLRPSSGQIRAFGQIRAKETDFHEVRARAGLLFQDADDQLFCPTVGEDVAFGPLNLGKSRDDVRAVVADTLAALDLAGYERRITYQLSGGEKRLVALATVLAMDPEVLLLDEPTAGLDDQARDRVIRILEGLDHAMVVVSHDRAFLDRIATRLLWLDEGKLYSSTEPTQRTHEPKPQSS